jgi:hypothetical protein
LTLSGCQPGENDQKSNVEDKRVEVWNRSASAASIRGGQCCVEWNKEKLSQAGIQGSRGNEILHGAL